MKGAGCSNNVCVGNQAMRGTGDDSHVQNNTVVGSNALRGPDVGSGIVAVGMRVGFHGTTSLGAIGDGAAMIGANTCDMDGNGYVGAYTVSLGTASGAPGYEYTQQKVDYVMNIRIDENTNRLFGDESITYKNNSKDYLEYLWVQLDQNM